MHLGMLEAKTLHRVGQLDVDSEVVRVELQGVPGRETALGIDLHLERGDRAVDRKPPVPVAVGMAFEVDHPVHLVIVHRLGTFTRP